MILRPIEPAAPASANEFLPAWNVVERIQRQQHKHCWMITQPSHAALAGELAAKLTGTGIPKLEAEIVRAIALHDAGWGIPDAQAIMQSRASAQNNPGQSSPKSFIECGVGEFVAAWEKSIEIAESSGAAGGYIVSRHFFRLAEHGLEKYPERDRPKVRSFIERETVRQKQLAAKQNYNQQELEQLTDVLQLCDLLSLYVCCGARESVEFPEYFDMKIKLRVEGESYKLTPGIIEAGAKFKVAALRHPAAKGETGKEIEIEIG